MSDPPRLIDTASNEAELLEAWSSMRAPDHARAKALALAGLGAGAAATAAGASMAAKSGATAGVGSLAGAGGAVASATATGAGVVAAKWMAAIAVVAAIGGGSVVASKQLSAPTAPIATTAQVAAPAVPVEPARREEELHGAPSAVPPTPVIAPGDLPNVEPKRVHSATTSSGPKPARAAPIETPAESTPEPAPVASTLGAEVSALDSARTALRTGEPARALRELDAFDAQHPTSALTEDAALLRFDAYVALGDRAGANKAARAFLARYPSSPRATKVRRYLDGAN